MSQDLGQGARDLLGGGGIRTRTSNPTWTLAGRILVHGWHLEIASRRIRSGFLGYAPGIPRTFHVAESGIEFLRKLSPGHDRVPSEIDDISQLFATDRTRFNAGPARCTSPKCALIERKLHYRLGAWISGGQLRPD